MSNESRLRVVRNELKVSREKLAFLAGGEVCTSTVRNAEIGKHRLTVSKAQSILLAINGLLAKAQKPTMSMDDLEIRLY